MSDDNVTEPIQMDSVGSDGLTRSPWWFVLCSPLYAGRVPASYCSWCHRLFPHWNALRTHTHTNTSRHKWSVKHTIPNVISAVFQLDGKAEVKCDEINLHAAGAGPSRASMKQRRAVVTAILPLGAMLAMQRVDNWLNTQPLYCMYMYMYIQTMIMLLVSCGC